MEKPARVPEGMITVRITERAICIYLPAWLRCKLGSKSSYARVYHDVVLCCVLVEFLEKPVGRSYKINQDTCTLRIYSESLIRELGLARVKRRCPAIYDEERNCLFIDLSPLREPRNTFKPADLL